MPERKILSRQKAFQKFLIGLGILWGLACGIAYLLAPSYIVNSLIKYEFSQKARDWHFEMQDLEIIAPSKFHSSISPTRSQSELMNNFARIGEIAQMGLYDALGELKWRSTNNTFSLIPKHIDTTKIINNGNQKILAAQIYSKKIETNFILGRELVFAEVLLPYTQSGATIGYTVLTYDVTRTYSWYKGIIEFAIITVFGTIFTIFLVIFFSNQIRIRAEEKSFAKADSHRKEIEHENKSREIINQTIREFAEWLQTCKSTHEMFGVVETFMSRIFPQYQGAFYFFSSDRNHLKLATKWANGELNAPEKILPDACWALRKGRKYTFGDAQISLHCKHADTNLKHYECFPMLANGEAIGLISLATKEGAFVQRSLEQELFLVNCIEQISLALSNTILRDQLEEQSLRDPLTGLFNRRGMEQSIEQLISTDSQLYFCIIDLDHFKKFNDTYGHDVGDEVLCAVARLVQSSANDLAYRLGGEEIALSFISDDKKAAYDFFDTLCRNINELEIVSSGEKIPHISASLGVTQYTAEQSLSALLKAADIALYEAKNRGRNQVVWKNEIGNRLLEKSVEIRTKQKPQSN